MDSSVTKYQVMFSTINALSKTDVRSVFRTIRKTPSSDATPVHDMLLPRFGITVGEFAVGHVLSK